MTKHIRFNLLIFTFLWFSSFLLAKPLIPLQGSNNMSKHNIHFTQSNDLLEKFIKDPSELYAGDFIKKSIAELDKVDLDSIKNRQEYKEQRQIWLALHLKIVATIDQFYNPNSSPTFYLNVLPPEIDGVSYPFPIDPQEIKDPKVRAQYEQDIQENERNQKEADLQLILQRLTGNDPTLDPKASYIEELKKKIPVYYTEYAEDKVEYKKLVEESSLNQQRKEEFYQLLQ